MARAFLDANVLFSAAYRDDAGLRKLWSTPAVTLVTSTYAIEEARRNLTADRHAALDGLVAKLEVVGVHAIPENAHLATAVPDKDQPIIAAAIAARCTHLLTGDQSHFGSWFGKKLGGVLVMRPREFLGR